MGVLSVRIAGERIRLVDFDRPDANVWLAVNQFTVLEAGENRRPDALLFVNGLPLVIMELKDPTTETTDIWSAFNQLRSSAVLPNVLTLRDR